MAFTWAFENVNGARVLFIILWWGFTTNSVSISM